MVVKMITIGYWVFFLTGLTSFYCYVSAAKALNDNNNTELLLSIGCLKRSPHEINPFKCVSRSCDHVVTDLGLRLVRWFAAVLRYDADTVTSEVGTAVVDCRLSSSIPEDPGLKNKQTKIS